jgi:hypothetical protein
MVSVDARRPNPLLHEALLAGRLPPFAGYRTIRREVCLGESRLDFLLEDQERRCWIETKSVTLVENGVALFPDALTVRGRRHLAALRAGGAGGPIAKVPGVAHDTIVVGGTSPTEAQRLPYQPACRAADNRCRRQIGFVDLHVLRCTVAQTAIVGHGQGHLLAACRAETMGHINTAAGGQVNSLLVRKAKVLKEAVRVNAPALILSRNHPSGDPTPSPEDVRGTGLINKGSPPVGS